MQYIFLRCCVFIIGEDPDAGKDGRQEEKGMIEDEMVGWHHQLHGPEFEQTSGDDKGPGSVGCCSPWGGKESDTTERLNNNVFMKYTTFLTHANALSMSLTYKLFYRLGFKRSHRIYLITTIFLIKTKGQAGSWCPQRPRHLTVQSFYFKWHELASRNLTPESPSLSQSVRSERHWCYCSAKNSPQMCF